MLHEMRVSFVRGFDIQLGELRVLALTKPVEIEDGKRVKLRFRLKNDPYQNGSNCSYYFKEYLAVFKCSSELTRGSLVEMTGTLEVRVKEGKNEGFQLMYPEIDLIDTTRTSRGGKWDNLMIAVEKVQDKFSLILSSYLPEPHGSLLVGILLGLKRQMPDNFYQELIETGTLHVIAASGFNITVVANILLEVLGKMFSKRKAIFASFIGIFAYTLLAGASAPVVRAAIMGLLAYTASFLGKEYLASWALIITAIVMLIVDSSLGESVGFWLSISATGGILWLSKGMEVALGRIGNAVGRKVGVDKLTWWNKKSRKLISNALLINLSTTLAAQVATTPILLTVFKRYSVVSPLVNMLVLWLVPLVMLMGALKLSIGLIWLPLVTLINGPTYVLLATFIAVISVFSELPFASLDLATVQFIEVERWGLILSIGYYLGICAVFVGVKYGIVGELFGRRKAKSRGGDRF